MYFIVKALFQKEKLKFKPEHADSVNISIINVISCPVTLLTTTLDAF